MESHTQPITCVYVCMCALLLPLEGVLAAKYVCMYVCVYVCMFRCYPLKGY